MDVTSLQQIYQQHNFEFNERAVKKFIASCNPDVRNIIKKILDNTLYVSFNDFIRQLNKMIDSYISSYQRLPVYEERPVYISKNIHSKPWLNNYVSEYINSKLSGVQIIEVDLNMIDTIDFSSDDIIIFVDDCLYSGASMGTLVDMYRSIKNRVNFYMLIPYGSLKAKNYIQQRYNGIESISRQKSKRQKTDSTNLIFCDKMVTINTITDILDVEDLDLLSDYYYESLLNTHLDSDLSLIYFDHNLADKNSVPAIIYLGVVANRKNQSYFQQHPLKYIADFEKISENLDIIPIINNCDYYTRGVSIDSPKCPYPPHQDGFTDFIGKLSVSGGMRKGKRILKSSRLYN